MHLILMKIENQNIYKILYKSIMNKKDEFKKLKKYIGIEEKSFNKLKGHEKDNLLKNAKNQKFEEEHPYIYLLRKGLSFLLDKIKKFLYKIIEVLKTISKKSKNKVKSIHRKLSKKTKKLMNSENMENMIYIVKDILSYIYMIIKQICYEYKDYLYETDLLLNYKLFENEVTIFINNKTDNNGIPKQYNNFIK